MTGRATLDEVPVERIIAFLSQFVALDDAQREAIRRVTRVERYELPKVLALNFVLYDALAGGASRSLRIDTQGKLLATSLLDLTFHANAWEDGGMEGRSDGGTER